MKDPQLESYCEQIETFFFRWKERPGLFSPEDFALLKKWFSDGVSLDVVLEAIEAAFQSKQSGQEVEEVNSLSYCEPFVRQAMAHRKHTPR